MKAERQQKEATSRAIQSKGKDSNLADNRPNSIIQAGMVAAIQPKKKIERKLPNNCKTDSENPFRDRMNHTKVQRLSSCLAQLKAFTSLNVIQCEDPQDSVEIAENEIKHVSSDQSIKYPGVSSCMTITCVLSDGSKVGGHAGLFYAGGTAFTDRMKETIDGKEVKKVIAKGHGGAWGFQLESAEALLAIVESLWLSKNAGKKGSDFKELKSSEVTSLYDGIVITGTSINKEMDFKAWLSEQFGTTDVVFENVGDGDVII